MQADTLDRRTAVVHRPVEHCDTDSYGVVHFSRYPAVMEGAALRLLEQNGAGLEPLRAAGFELRVRELKLKYRAAARFGDVLVIQAQFAHVAPAHVRVKISAFRRDGGDEPIVEGELNVVFVDAVAGHPVALPPPLALLEVRS